MTSARLRLWRRTFCLPRAGLGQHVSRTRASSPSAARPSARARSSYPARRRAHRSRPRSVRSSSESRRSWSSLATPSADGMRHTPMIRAVKRDCAHASVGRPRRRRLERAAAVSARADCSEALAERPPALPERAERCERRADPPAGTSSRSGTPSQPPPPASRLVLEQQDPVGVGARQPLERAADRASRVPADTGTARGRGTGRAWSPRAGLGASRRRSRRPLRARSLNRPVTGGLVSMPPRNSSRRQPAPRRDLRQRRRRAGARLRVRAPPEPRRRPDREQHQEHHQDRHRNVPEPR